MKNTLKTAPDLCYRVEKWPRTLFEDECRDGGFLASTINEKAAPQWAPFCRELFARLYGVGCTKLDAPGNGAEWAGELHEQADAIPEWADLFGRTKGDAWRSALVAAQAASVLASHVPELPQDDAEALHNELETLRDIAKDHPSATLQADIGELEARVVDAQRASSKAVDKMRERSGFAIRSALRTAARQAAGAMQQVDDAMHGLGASDAGTSALARRAMLSTVCSNDRIRRIAALAGRLRTQAARKQREKTTQERQEIVSITKGDNLQRLLASEVGLLSSPVTRPFVLERVAEKRALQYELGGKSTKVRGPVVYLIDKSGSMREHARDEWAAAVAMAMMHIAQLQKRPFAVAFFTTSVDDADCFYFGPNDASPERIMAMLSVMPNGGTEIANALSWAAGIVEGTNGVAQWPHGTRADVVLISDGDDSSSLAEPVARLKAEGASLYSIVVECAPSAELLDVSTEVVRVSPNDMQGATPKLDGVFSI